MGSAILPARLKTLTRINFVLSSRPSEQGTQALKLLERAGGIKGLELDRNIETVDEAGPGAVHVPAGKGGRGGDAVDADRDRAGSSRLCIINRIKTSGRFAGTGASLLSAFP